MDPARHSYLPLLLVYSLALFTLISKLFSLYRVMKNGAGHTHKIVHMHRTIFFAACDKMDSFVRLLASCTILTRKLISFVEF